jgi:hypothetical protein
MKRSLPLLAGLALALLATGCAGAASPASTGDADMAALAAVSRPPVRKATKLLVVVEENHSLAQMRDGMPYTFGLAREFGYATHYDAVMHPSLPNYLAIAGGQTYGVTDDGSPAAHPLSGPSVFGQALVFRRTAAVFAQSMPGRCVTGDSAAYAVRHNPWTYFVDERRQCRAHDLPYARFAKATADGTLPRAGMLIPDLDHDAHNGTLATADAWFRDVMTAVFAGPDWRSGHLAVVLTADEDDRHHGNRVLTVLIHPSQRGNVVTTPLDHYSLTRLYAEVSRTPPLNGAADATSMATAFGMPVPAGG